MALTIALGGALVAIGLAAILLLGRGAHVLPSPLDGEGGTLDDDGFPTVDWEYWQRANPRVVAWITIPGTNVNHPIVQAPEDDPLHYLTHDVFDKVNFTGCPYLDPACSLADWESCRNVVVYGHNMGWNQDMFGDIELYSQEDFADTHRFVLLQRPECKQRLAVSACSVEPGWSPIKRTSFEDEDDFDKWWRARYRESCVRLCGDAKPCSRLLTLCTCSYLHWDDERTLLYCIEEANGGQSRELYVNER